MVRRPKEEDGVKQRLPACDIFACLKLPWRPSFFLVKAAFISFREAARIFDKALGQVDPLATLPSRTKKVS